MFVRTILTLSLSCIFAGTALAASTAEQPLNPKVLTDVAVQDPIDPLAADAASSPVANTSAKITAQEQKDLNKFLKFGC